MIRFDCPHCGSRLSAPEALQGSGGRCRTCKAMVILPALEGADTPWEELSHEEQCRQLDSLLLYTSGQTDYLRSLLHEYCDENGRLIAVDAIRYRRAFQRETNTRIKSTTARIASLENSLAVARFALKENGGEAGTGDIERITAELQTETDSRIALEGGLAEATDQTLESFIENAQPSAGTADSDMAASLEEAKQQIQQASRQRDAVARELDSYHAVLSEVIQSREEVESERDALAEHLKETRNELYDALRVRESEEAKQDGAAGRVEQMLTDISVMRTLRDVAIDDHSLMEVELRAVRCKWAEVDAERVTIAANLARLQEQIDSGAEMREEVSHERAALLDEFERLNEEFTYVDELAARYGEEIARLREELAATRVDTLEAEALHGHVKAMEEEVARLEGEHEATEQALEELQADVEYGAVELDTVSLERDMLRLEKRDLIQESDALRDVVAKNAAELDRQRIALAGADAEDAPAAPPVPSTENSDEMPVLPGPQALVSEFEAKMDPDAPSKPKTFIDRRKKPREKAAESDSLMLSSPSADDRAEDAPETEPDRLKRIGEMMIEAGIIDTHQLDDALKRQKKKGGRTAEALIKLGHMSGKEFADFLGRQGMPSIALKKCRINDSVLSLVPEAFAVKNEVFPIDRLGKLLTVGMVCPLDTATIDELEGITGLTVKPLLCTRNDLHDSVLRYYSRDALRLAEGGR